MIKNYFNKAAECMPRGELKNLQSERLVKQVKYVYENVAPYRAKMDALKLKPSDIKSTGDLYKLPFTEKTDLRDNYPFKLFARPRRDIVRLHASSGTTGKLTVVGYTKNDLDMWSEIVARSLASAGATPDSVIHVAFGYGLFTGGLGIHDGATRLGASVVPVGSGNMSRQIMLMKDFSADVLCCTPSYACYIAEELVRAGVKPQELALNSGVFGAEPWTEEMRADIQNKLGIKAYDIYGLSEITGPGVSMECSQQNGMHVWEDHFIPEILNEDLMPAKCGESGELVFSTITKEGMPLLRYRTRDLCVLSDAPCACGRTHIKMGKISGRTDDMLIIRGVNVFPSQIETVLLRFSGKLTPNYQIIVSRENNLDIMEVRAELSEELFSDEVRKIESLKREIECQLRDMLGLSAIIKLTEPRSLSRSEGKAVRVIDNRKK